MEKENKKDPTKIESYIISKPEKQIQYIERIPAINFDNKTAIDITKHRIQYIANTHVSNPKSKYVFTPDLQNIYAKMLRYFSGVEEEGKGDWPLHKSIALTGHYGVGKTTIFNVFHEYIRTYHKFNGNLFIPCSIEEILSVIKNSDWKDSKYCLNRVENSRGGFEYKPKHILLNEFGAKLDVKIFGSSVNDLMEAFIMFRYEIYQRYKKHTHITTNYGTDQFLKMLDPKLVDRFKEMFKLVELKGDSFRA